ncbi:MAG: DUF2057 domain-containing protein [Pseudomonadales bacterium]|nr:DUF2057 domain-containing protein [Pseudomonadales bacterium]
MRFQKIMYKVTLSTVAMRTNVMFEKLSSKLLVAIFIGAFMSVSGCAIIASKHKLYDGEVAGAVTILSSPTVQVTYIDNRDMGYSFVGQEKEFSVLPGEHTLIIEYADFWSPATGDDEKLVSPPVKLTFIAEPSQTYQILHEPLLTLESSQDFAKTPLFFVENVVTKSVVDAVFDVSAPKSFVPKFKFETTPEYEFASDNVVAESVEKIDVPARTDAGRVSRLQQLWGGATQDEKTAFLQWITVK